VRSPSCALQIAKWPWASLVTGPEGAYSLDDGVTTHSATGWPVTASRIVPSTIGRLPSHGAVAAGGFGETGGGGLAPPHAAASAIASVRLRAPTISEANHLIQVSIREHRECGRTTIMRRWMVGLVLACGCSSKAAAPASTADGAPYPCASLAACETGCDSKHAAKCARAAELSFVEAEAFDVKKSFRYATLACDGGDAMGCTLLGLHYQDGIGAEWAPDKALALYERACTGGNGTGCFNVATMYSGGHGVDVDHAKADDYKARAEQAWDKACHGDAPRFCTNLAYLMQVKADGSAAGSGASPSLAINQRGCDHGVLVGCVEALQDRRRAKMIAQRLYKDSCSKVGGAACAHVAR